MTYHITLSPSGRVFTVEPDETILEASLRQGCSVNYHCANGRCGDCRAHIIEGSLAEHTHYDYAFKGADRQRPMLLMCRARPASDMVLEAKEIASVSDIPVQTLKASVRQIERLQDDFAVVHLRTPRSKTMQFFAGQHVALKIGGMPPRNKSIASCPCNGRELQFHFRRVADDPVSHYVFNELALRDQIEIEGPFGSFVLDGKSNRPIVFIAFESGFAPIKSLIEHAIALDISVPIKLYWVARDHVIHYLENYCRSWRDAMDDFEFNLISVADPGEETDICDIMQELNHDNGELIVSDIYVTGPPGFQEEVKRCCQLHHVAPSQVHGDPMSRDYQNTVPGLRNRVVQR